MSFAEPRLLLLVAAAPVAGLAVWWLLAGRARRERSWVGRALVPRLRLGRSRPVLAVALLAGLAVAGLALALARPRWGSATRTVERRGVDVVFVLDTSLSMAATDVAPSRFWLAQSLVRRMAGALAGDRVALVAAEGVGAVLAPLTVDGAAIDLLLDTTEPDALAVPGSKLGPALERALALFPAESDTHPVLIVVSDGEVHGERLDEIDARLRAAGVIVHAVGVGTSHGGPIPLPGPGGTFHRDARGQVVVTRLEPVPLEQLAAATGGLYLAAADATADPEPLLRSIRSLRGRRLDATTLELHEERFQWPLAAAVLALAIWLALGAFAPPPRTEPT